MRESSRGERFPGPDISRKESKEDLATLPIYIYVIEKRRLYGNHVTRQGFGFSQEVPESKDLRYVWEGKLFGMASDTKSSMSCPTIGELAKNFAEAYPYGQKTHPSQHKSMAGIDLECLGRTANAATRKSATPRIVKGKIVSQSEGFPFSMAAGCSNQKLYQERGSVYRAVGKNVTHRTSNFNKVQQPSTNALQQVQ
jgi:hypothetical protein